MKQTYQHSASISRLIVRLSLAVLLLLFLVPAYAQNTKGDQPAKPSREARFKSKKTKGKSKGIGKRVGSRNKARAATATKKGEKAGKPANPFFYRAKSPQGKEKAWKGDITGRRIPSSRSQSDKARNVYPQSGKYMAQKGPSEKDPQQRWRAGSRQRVQVRSATGKTRNVYPQYNRFVNNASRKPQRVERPVSNAPQLAKLKKMQTQPQPPKRKRVVPVSASRPYIRNKSINPYAGFWSKKQKGERAYQGDISGRRLRTKNYQTPTPGISNPRTTPYYGRKRKGDQPYKGPTLGGYKSATVTGKAWKGDISGRRIRGRNFSSKPGTEISAIFSPKKRKPGYQDKPYKGMMPGGGYKSISQSGEKRTGKGPIPVRAPGIGANKIDKYQGNIRFRKTFTPQGEGYSGNIRGKKTFSDQGEGYAGNIRGRKTFRDQGELFTGSIKARKPLKGGGSVSGKLWNNKGQPILGRAPGKTDELGARYQGNIRFRKTFNDQGEEYTGSIKARKPMKGGGSVSGKLWNNKGQPILGRAPSKTDEQQATYQGNLRFRKSFGDQGEEYTGNIKAKKPEKGGGSVSGKLWNNKETPIPGRYPPGRNDERMAAFGGTMKVNKKEPSKDVGGLPKKKMKLNYVRNPNAAEEALKKRKPGESTYKVDGLQVKVKEKDYSKKPHAADGSLPGIGPTKSSIKASEYARGIKLEWNYKRNPSSADEALKTREPGKAFARATDYQGNIKMKKYELFAKKNLHPDAQFVKLNKNNVKEEKGLLTNFKLLWARWFKKSDTQPDHLKEKIQKPRYDKGEQGLWYD